MSSESSSSEFDEMCAARDLLRDKLIELSTAMQFVAIVANDAVESIGSFAALVADKAKSEPENG